MFKRPRVAPIIADVQSYQPPTPMPATAQGEVHQAQVAAANVVAAVILNQHYIDLMTIARNLCNELPASLQDSRTGRFPILDELYCRLGLMRIDIARLNGERVERDR